MRAEHLSNQLIFNLINFHVIARFLRCWHTFGYLVWVLNSPPPLHSHTPLLSLDNHYHSADLLTWRWCSGGWTDTFLHLSSDSVSAPPYYTGWTPEGTGCCAYNSTHISVLSNNVFSKWESWVFLTLSLPPWCSLHPQAEPDSSPHCHGSSQNYVPSHGPWWLLPLRQHQRSPDHTAEKRNRKINRSFKI